jgi:multimeric flavodoxin WrbA
LAGKRVEPCNGCEACIEAGACVIDDDMTPLYPLLLEADAIVVGTPVYFGTVSGLCKAFMERVEGLGIAEKRLRLKVGGAIATGASRNGGQENALATLHLWFHINDMLPVGTTSPVTQWGVAGHTGHPREDVVDDVIPLKMSGREIRSLEAAWLYGRKVATVTRIVDAGRRSTGLDLPDLRPYGFDEPPFPEGLGAVLDGSAELPFPVLGS